jgi:hypothetical protein
VGFVAQSILDVDGGTRSASSPVRFTAEKKASSINSIGGRVSSRVGLDVLKQIKVFPTYRDLKPIYCTDSPEAVAAVVSSPLSPYVPQSYVTFF